MEVGTDLALFCIKVGIDFYIILYVNKLELIWDYSVCVKLGLIWHCSVRISIGIDFALSSYVHKLVLIWGYSVCVKLGLLWHCPVCCACQMGIGLALSCVYVNFD